MLGIIIPIDFHIFQRGRYTTNQYRWLLQESTLQLLLMFSACGIQGISPENMVRNLVLLVPPFKVEIPVDEIESSWDGDQMGQGHGGIANLLFCG